MALIVCIDDEEELLEDIVEELNAAGHKTLEASNGRDGIALIIEHNPDLILCDVGMPEMNGYEVLNAIQEEGAYYAHTPFIFLTALGDRKDIINGKKIGADDYLVKPVDFEILLTAIENRLGKRAKIASHREAELDQLRESVLGILPHEFRTPLNHIIGFSDMISNEYFGPVGSAEYIDYAKQINTSAVRLQNMAQGILTLLSVLMDKEDGPAEECDPRSIIKHCMGKISETVDKKGLRITLNIADNTHKIHARADHLRQIIDALLSNAVKFTPENGKICVVSFVGPDNILRISVSNDGDAIPENEISNIFKAFCQMSSGMTREYDGAGIGLALSKALTEHMGGTISLTSDDHGTDVTIAFPEKLIMKPSLLEAVS